jgi:hypothetical protein
MHVKAPATAAKAHSELLAYWTSLKGGRSMPSRADIDPVEIKRHLPQISLIDVAPGSFRSRLAGTGLFSVYGQEITGLDVSDVFTGDELTYWQGELTKVVNGAKPSVGLQDMAWRGHPSLSILWLRLPLSSNGKDVDMILGYDAVVSAVAPRAAVQGQGQTLSSGIRAA